HGAHVDGPSPDGRTPLMFAAMFNRTDIVELLLDRGAQIDKQDNQGTTALACAMAMNAHDAVALLQQRSQA
ncbi:MAG: ankyrin repeat domain-containing protein, partial [Comamonas sp.]